MSEKTFDSMIIGKSNTYYRVLFWAILLMLEEKKKKKKKAKSCTVRKGVWFETVFQ